MAPLIAPTQAPDDGEDGEGPGVVVETDAPADADEVLPIPALWEPVPRDEQGLSAYGLYLGGRYLVGRGPEIEGDAGAGAAALADALSLTPEQPLLAEQAFVAALLAGDLDAALASQPARHVVSPTLTGAARLVQAVVDLERGAARRAARLLGDMPVEPPHANAAMLVQPWIAAAARDWEMALQPPPAVDNALVRVMRLHRAQILESRRRFDEAEAVYKGLVQAIDSQPAFRAAYGEFLSRRGRRKEASDLFAATPARDVNNPFLLAAMSRHENGGRAPRLPTYRQGASRALLLASSLAQEMRASQFAAVYSRLALELTPDDEHRLHYAEALASARLNGTARGVLGQIGTAQPEIYTNAQAQLGESLARAGRQDEALLAYQRAVAASPASVPASLALAGQLVSMERNREALAVLDGPTLGSTAQTGFLRFLRGAAYEGLGFSQEAEAELLAAVTAQPDNPMYLNYLGYLWVDSGSRIDEGAALISRAFNALPADGNIQDSLGWAQYRQGRFEQAVETLEGAVSKEPANAEINDHLGDAYWQVGRRREAGFQWRRVLTLDPDDERKASVERKLVEGLVLPQTTSPQSGSAPGADTI
jgi:tetratricopeptide (TPR) repeat protein